MSLSQKVGYNRAGAAAASKFKFDLVGDRDGMQKAGANGTASYDSLLVSEAEQLKKMDAEFGGFPANMGELNNGAIGPFEITPNLAQVRLVHTLGMVMPAGEKGSASILWSHIVSSLGDPGLKAQLGSLSPMQTLPSGVKITAATVGNNPAYRNMCHVKVFDGSDVPKVMNTPHLYRQGDSASAADITIGYPLHLLSEEGGFLLEEPPQLTDTFKHYWYISNSMLSSSAYKQESAQGTFISIPKNSDAARLMYFVLVIKNGAGAATPEENVTGLDAAGYQKAFRDGNEFLSWRFPEHTFNEVCSLLAGKLEDVRSKSFDCSKITVEVEAFKIFKSAYFSAKTDIPVLITLEIDLHLPLKREAVDKDIKKAAPHALKASGKRPNVPVSTRLAAAPVRSAAPIDDDDDNDA